MQAERLPRTYLSGKFSAFSVFVRRGDVRGNDGGGVDVVTQNDERRSSAEIAIDIDHERELLHDPSRDGTQHHWCTLFALMPHADKPLVS